VTRGCPVPVVVLGGTGEGRGSLDDELVAAVAGGARGAVYGRRVWRFEDPVAAIGRLGKVLHRAGAGATRG